MRKISISGLQKKLEHTQRDILIKKRGGKCELCGINPAVVADHCFSRKVRALFFDPANLTVLCGSCHFNKTLRQRAADFEIFEIVKRREGEEKFREMLLISKQHKPFPDFSKRSYLEKIANQLEV